MKIAKLPMNVCIRFFYESISYSIINDCCLEFVDGAAEVYKNLKFD